MPAFRIALAVTLAIAAAALFAHDTRNDLRFAFCEGRNCYINDMDSGEIRELARRHHRVAYFEHRGAEYVITDPATLDRIERILEPQMELGRKQAALGAEQAKLGAEQARLGSQQAALGARQAALALSEGAQAEMRDLSRRMNELGRQQSELGRQQSILGEKQGALGKQQGDAAREAKRKIAVLVEEAIRTGKATRR